jgi:PEP-CTERM motif-containing protein
LKKFRLVGYLLLISAGVTAGATTINFEQYADGTQITNQYPGVTFSNALELTANPMTGTLDPVAFPPHSGVGVITNLAPSGVDDPLFGQPNDPNAMLGISFGSSQKAVSFYYAAQSNITVNLFDSSNDLVDSLVATGGLTFPQGIATGTSVLLSINSVTAFSSLLITDGSGIQNGFVIDDLTYGAAGSTSGGNGPGGSTGSTGGDGQTSGGGGGNDGNPGTGATSGVVPEPGSWMLLGSGLIGVMGMVRCRLRM